jgi:hypothetical protein
MTADTSRTSPIRARGSGDTAMKSRLMQIGMTVVTLAALIEALGAGVKW